MYGVANQQGFLRYKDERLKELARYGWTPHEFHVQRQIPGNAIIAIKTDLRRRKGDKEPSYRTATVSAPKAPPAMAALSRWQPVGSSAGSAASGLTARSADCLHLSDKKIHDRGKNPRRGGLYRSHEHRHNTDSAYRLACQSAKPHPTPMRLQYTTGVWALEDGTDL